ncbi:type II toxin-antitoxin system PemK/MazF family toxin [Paenibacillus amylolyticus]|uniref:type II toxin-antitoxin system PemK/MazF family toxin n=1 Tax=Paenibacillus amylolyticus TaxID=1451 RepID=UPI0033959BC6
MVLQRNTTLFKRGESYWVELPDGEGSEQEGERPVLIVSNDYGNTFSPVVNVVPMTLEVKKPIPTHALIESALGLQTVLCEQVLTVDKSRLLSRHLILTPEDMFKVDKAMFNVFFYQKS